MKTPPRFRFFPRLLQLGAIVLACGGGHLMAAGAGWRLVWSDEFDRPGLPDPAKWDYEVGFVRNNEKQIYTARRPENARVENGMLILEARKETFANPLYRGEKPGAGAAKDQSTYEQKSNASRPSAEYTSASIITRHKAEWKYGRVEVRAKIPTGTGIWPAIWMLGTNRGPVRWPACGEIDIMESVGYDPDTIHGNLHLPARYNRKWQDKDKELAAAGMSGRTIVKGAPSAFHVYAMEWDHEAISIFVDDTKYVTYHNPHTGVEAWPFDQPFYLLLNVAIGGPWAGKHGVDDRIFPQRMEVDYVRVYEKAP